jgi:hypothetical protein
MDEQGATEVSMDKEIIHGWVSLGPDAEVFLEHGVPTRIWVGGMPEPALLLDEIRELTGLKVILGPWEAGEGSGELEAPLRVSSEYIGRLLEVLARASAETFYDRYHKPIDPEDTDFDEEAYAQDFNAALEYCGLHWGDVDKKALEQSYRATLHRVAEAMTRAPG